MLGVLLCLGNKHIGTSGTVPSDADDDDDGDDDGVPTTLPAWPRPRGYHAQGSNIPFGESLTLIYIYIYIYMKPARGPQTEFFCNYCSGIPGLANYGMPSEKCEGNFCGPF